MSVYNHNLSTVNGLINSRVNQILLDHSKEIDEGDFRFVIKLDDGNAKEFYLTTNGTLAGLSDKEQLQPMTLKTDAEVTALLDRLQKEYPANCRLYAVDHSEFEAQRRKVIALKVEKGKG